MAEYYLNTYTTSTSMPYMITSGRTGNLAWGSGGGISCEPYSPILPPASPPTALEWLDAEIEKTCALARAA